MRVEQTTTTRYRAADGAVFDSEEDCLAYEAALPRYQVYNSEKPRPGDLALGSPRLFEFGYYFRTSREEYEDGGFLREAGWSTVSEDHSRVLGLVFGTYADVVAYAVQNDEFWRRRSESFIVPKSLVVLTRAVLTPMERQP